VADRQRSIGLCDEVSQVLEYSSKVQQWCRCSA
jgi:hypothetical protein